MVKKKKIGNEMPSINFKLSLELKQWILEEAENEKLSVSNFIRKELTSQMKGDSISVDKEMYYEQTLVGSPRFLNLMVWMYRKRSERDCEIDNKKLGEYIDTLKEISNVFPKEIEVEFEKVLLAALKVRSKSSTHERVFKFGREYNDTNDHNTVNFELIENYLLVERNKPVVIKVS
jgi:hypothetical protein